MSRSSDLMSLLQRIATEVCPAPDAGLQFPMDIRSLEAMCQQVREMLTGHSLEDDEIVVIALICTGMNLPQVLPVGKRDTLAVLGSLESKGISENGERTAFRLQRNFASVLLKPRTAEGDSDSYAFESNRDYLLAWFNFVKRLQVYRERELEQHPIHGLASESRNRRGFTTTESERKFEHEHKLLLERSALDWQTFPMERLVRQLNLEDNSRLILFYVLLCELESERCTVEDLITLVSTDVFDRMGKEKYLKPSSPLRLYDLITVDDSRRKMRSQTAVQMRDSVQNWLMTGEGCIRGVTDIEDREPYASEYEHIEDWISYASMVIRIARLSGCERRYDDDEDDAVTSEYEGYSVTNHPLLKGMKARIEKRTTASTKRFPLDRVQERFKCTGMERDLLVMLLESATSGRDLTLDRLSGFLTSDPREQQEISSLFEPDRPLVSNGLVLVTPHRLSSKMIELSLSLRNYLLGVSDAFEISMTNPVESDDIFTLQRPTQTLDDLVVSDEIMSVLRTAVARYELNTNDKLQEWGILIQRDQNRQSSGSSMKFLFSGPSGTGKTYAAGALARSLGRDIVTTDISKLLSMWVGESQHNLVRMFDRYEVYCRRMERFPVLLMDECDQFFSQRSADAGRSVDKMYHQMQNLFLERLESFQGILCATTNLVEGLDTAFSRRFDWKLTFGLPKVEDRLLIWRLHLPPSVPLADDVDLQRLASEFEFSGGQISVAVRNACISAIVREDVVRMAHLLEACRAEEEGAFDSKAVSKRHAVGFCTAEHL